MNGKEEADDPAVWSGIGLLLVLLFVIAQSCACAKDEKKSEAAEVNRLAGAWLDTNDTPTEHARWVADTARRVKQRATDNDWDEQKAADSLLSEWARSIKALVDRTPKALEQKHRVTLCRWLLFYGGRDYLFDPSIAELVTVDNFKTWIAGGDVEEKIERQYVKADGKTAAATYHVDPKE